MKHKDELVALANVLIAEKFPAGFEFNLGIWRVRTSCNTAGCAIGLYSLLYPQSDLKIQDESPVICYSSGMPWKTGMRAVSSYFDLSPDAARFLFDPESYDNGAYTKPDVVGRRIKRLIWELGE